MLATSPSISAILVMRLEAEHIHVPIVSLRHLQRRPRRGRRDPRKRRQEYIPLPPDPS